MFAPRLGLHLSRCAKLVRRRPQQFRTQEFIQRMSLVRWYGSSNTLRNEPNLDRSQTSATSSTTNTRMTESTLPLFGKEMKVDEKFETFLAEVKSDLDSRNDIESFNRAFNHAKNLSQAMPLYEMLKESNVRPDIDSFNAMFKYFERDLRQSTSVDFENWYSVWRDLIKSQVALNPDCVDRLLSIMSHRDERNGDEAATLLDLIKYQGTPTLYPLAKQRLERFMQIFSIHSHIHGATAVLSQFAEQAISIPKHILSLASTLHNNLDQKSAQQFATYLSNLEYALEDKTFNKTEFLHKLKIQTRIENAFQMYEIVQSSDYQLNLEIHGTILRLLMANPVTSKNFERLKTVWNDLKASELSIDIGTTRLLLHSFRRHQYNFSHEEAIELYEVCRKKFDNLDAFSEGLFHSFLELYGAQSNSAGSSLVIQDLEDADKALNSKSYAAALAANVSNLNKSMELFKKMEEDGIVPADKHFLALSRSYAHHSKQRYKSYLLKGRSHTDSLQRQKRHTRRHAEDDMDYDIDLIRRASAITAVIEAIEVTKHESQDSIDEAQRILDSVRDGTIQFSQESLQKTFVKFLSTGDTKSGYSLIDWNCMYPDADAETEDQVDNPAETEAKEINEFDVKINQTEAAELFPNATLLAPTRDVIRYLVAAYTKFHDNADYHKELLEKLNAIDFPFNAFDYNMLLQSCFGRGSGGTISSKNADPKFAEQLFREMIDKDISPTAATFNSLIRVYDRASDLQSAERVFNEMVGKYEVEPTLNTYNTLMRCYGVSGELEKSSKLFEKMLENGVKPDYDTYRSLLKSLDYSKDGIKDVVQMLKKYDVSPNSVSVATVVGPFKQSKFINDREVAEAFGDVLALDPEFISPTEHLKQKVTFNDIKHAEQESFGTTEKALEIFHQMVESGNAPRSETANHVLSVMCNNPKAMVKAEEFARQYLFSEDYPRCKPTIRTFMHLVRGYGFAGDREGVKSTLDFMKERYPNIEVTASFFNALMYSHISLPLIKARDMYTQQGCKLTKAVFDQMPQVGLAPDTISYNIMLTAYAKAGRGEDADRLFQDMSAKGFVENDVTYFILLHAWANSGNVDKTKLVFNTYEQFLTKDLARAYAIMLHAHSLSADAEGARQCLSEAIDRGVEPTLVIYDTLIRAHVRARDPKGAAAVYDELINVGLKANKQVFSSLIVALGESGDVNDQMRAIEISNQMRQRGIFPSDEAVEALRKISDAVAASQKHKQTAFE